MKLEISNIISESNESISLSDDEIQKKSNYVVRGKIDVMKSWPKGICTKFVCLEGHVDCRIFSIKNPSPAFQYEVSASLLNTTKTTGDADEQHYWTKKTAVVTSYIKSPTPMTGEVLRNLLA